MSVRRAHLDERDVERDPAVFEEAGDLPEEDGRVVGPPLRDRLPDVRPDEEGVVPEVVAPFRLNVRGDPQRQDVDDLRSEDLLGPPHERLHESLGLGRARAKEDVVAALDDGDRGLRRADLLRVLAPPVDGFGHGHGLHAGPLFGTGPEPGGAERTGASPFGSP